MSIVTAVPVFRYVPNGLNVGAKNKRKNKTGRECL
jgi:hypothetical protein